MSDKPRMYQQLVTDTTFHYLGKHPKLLEAAPALLEALRLALVAMENAPTLANEAEREIARAALAKAGVQS